MEHIFQDLRYAVRTLRAYPVFAAATVLTLALGIGANTAIFSVVRAVLLRPLPYPDAERIITLRSNMSVPNLDDTRAMTGSFESAGGVTILPVDLTGHGEPIATRAALVDRGLFDALGARTELGRVLLPEEDRFGGERAVVLSQRFWKRQFGEQPDIVGNALTLGGESYTVTGVLAEEFELPESNPDLFLSVRVAYPLGAEARGAHFLRTYWKMKAGVTQSQAQADLDAAASRLAGIDPVENNNMRIVLVPLRERIAGPARPALSLLFGAVGFVLLVACANFANLLLSRSASRQHELAVRAALGAGRGRLIGQMLTESILLAALGGAVGFGLASWGVEALLSLRPAELPKVLEVKMDGGVLLFAASVSLLTGILFGLIPALIASRAATNDSLKEGGRGIAGRGRHRARAALVVSEVAIAVILTVGAGLLINSFWRLCAVEPGFEPAGMLTMAINLPEARYKEVADQTRFRYGLVDGLNSVPGLHAALISELPLGEMYLEHNAIVEGQPEVPAGEEPELGSRTVAGDYFGVMGIPILEGRGLLPSDTAEAPLVGVANQAMARQYFPNGGALGSRMRWARLEGPPQWITIVGIAGNVRQRGLNRDESPAIYTPFAQQGQVWKRWMTVVARTERADSGVADAIRRRVWEIDPLLSVGGVRPMDEIMASSMADQRFNTTLLGLFCALAVTLAAIGIYGVLAYSVAERTHELGLRVVLGAQAKDIAGLVLGQGLGLTALGIALGIAGAAALSRFVAGLLFGVSATDPATYFAAILLLVAVAFLACIVPAWRALRVDPIHALREG